MAPAGSPALKGPGYSHTAATRPGRGVADLSHAGILKPIGSRCPSRKKCPNSRGCIDMQPLSLGQFLALRLGKPKACDQTNGIRDKSDCRRCISEVDSWGCAWHHAGELCRQQSSRGANHPAANVGRKALTSAPQVGWINTRQVIAPEAELGHCEEPDEENTILQNNEAAGSWEDEYQRDQNQPR